jgi:hypothetical protein
MRVLLAGTILIAAWTLSPRLATANDAAPWCAVVSTGYENVFWDCQYRTFEDCYPNVLAGNRGFCNHNPAYVAPGLKPKPHGKRRARRH